MTAILSPQQPTTWDSQGFLLPVPPQARSSSDPTASLMGTRTNLDERASGIIQFLPEPGLRPSHQPALTFRLWCHLVYYYMFFQVILLMYRSIYYLQNLCIAQNNILYIYIM